MFFIWGWEQEWRSKEGTEKVFQKRIKKINGNKTFSVAQGCKSCMEHGGMGEKKGKV